MLPALNQIISGFVLFLRPTRDILSRDRTFCPARMPAALGKASIAVPIGSKRDSSSPPALILAHPLLCLGIAMDAPTTTRHSRWLPVIVGLLVLVVLMQLALLFQRQARTGRPYGFFAEAPRPSWLSQMKARLWPPAKAVPVAAPLTPDTVWDDFHRMEIMHAKINRMFEEASRTSELPPPSAAAVSNAEAGSSAFADPWRHMQAMRRQIDAMFATARNDNEPGAGRTGFEDGWAALAVTPGMTVRDTGDTYEISVPLPGFDKSAIHVTLHGSLLDIVAEQRRDMTGTNHTSAAWTTHSSSRFERRLLLPRAGPRPDAVRASYKDDVLRVSVPKAEAKQNDDSGVPVN